MSIEHNKGLIDAIFLGFKKAFNNVLDKKHFHKLTAYGIQGQTPLDIICDRICKKVSFSHTHFLNFKTS